MASRFDVAIAGAGIIGASIAWRLAQKGLSVALFDAGKLGGEASWAGAGMLAPGGEFDEDTSLAKLGIESLRMYPEFIAELELTSQIEIDFRISGALSLAYSTEETESLERKAALQSNLGIRSFPYSVEQVQEHAPSVRLECLAAARFYPDDALVNPRDVMRALRTACAAHGVMLFEDTTIQAIEANGGAVRFSAKTGTVEARKAVVAAGAWSSQIAGHGIPALPASEPVKGQLIAYQLARGTVQPILRRGHNYLAQRANGVTLAGATVERAGFDRTVRPETSRKLHEQTSQFVSAVHALPIFDAWTGFRPAAAGQQLYMGHWSGPVWLAFGHYRNGILLAPLSAARIAAEITSNWGKA